MELWIGKPLSRGAYASSQLKRSFLMLGMPWSAADVKQSETTTKNTHAVLNIIVPQDKWL